MNKEKFVPMCIGFMGLAIIIFTGLVVLESQSEQMNICFSSMEEKYNTSDIECQFGDYLYCSVNDGESSRVMLNKDGTCYLKNEVKGDGE